MSEVVAYRISDDIRCLAPPGGEHFTQPPDSLTPCLTFNLIPPTKKFSRGSGHVPFSSPADVKPSGIRLVSNYFQKARPVRLPFVANMNSRSQGSQKAFDYF